MFLAEAAGYPVMTSVAQSAYDRLWRGEPIDYLVLRALVDEASGTGVLRGMRHKYGATAFEAIIMPICQEIGRQAPVGPRRRPSPPPGSEDDPLTAPTWPPRAGGPAADVSGPRGPAPGRAMPA